MRFAFLFLTVFSISFLYGQSDSAVLDKKFKFRDGIYTTNFELIENAPKYPDYLLEIKHDFGALFNVHSYYFYKEGNNRQTYEDSLFAYVYNGTLLIEFKNDFYKPILVGAITTFFSEVIVDYTDQYSKAYHKLFFVDLLSGKADRLYPENIEDIIERDRELYSDYSSLSYKKQNKTLYSFVLKYNSRNPIIIRQF